MADDPGTAGAVLWVDVSHHDWNRRGGNLDWARVRAATSPVMMARATYGDPNRFAPRTHHFGDFQRAAQAAGFVLRGGYHNLIRGDVASMRRQVDWFRRELETYGCQWAMLDIERYAELVNNNLWPRWDDVLRFRDAWHAVESRPLVYYLPRWVWGYYGGADLRVLPGPLLQSHYAGGDGTPAQIYRNAGGNNGTGWDDFYGWRYPDAWQYTNTANVDGASSQTGANAFRGSLDELTALLMGGSDMSAQAEAQINTLYRLLVDGVRTQGSWTHPVDGESQPINPLFNALWQIGKGLRQLGANLPELSEEELARLHDAARQGAEAGVAAGADEIAAAVVALLPDNEPLTKADVEAALTRVLGSTRLVPESS